jgi:hypothetical protein
MVDRLRENDYVVEDVRLCLSKSEYLADLPRLLRELLEKRAWVDRVIARNDRPAHNETFAQFITRAPLEGLGMKIDTIRDILRGDLATLDLIDHELQRGPGRPSAEETFDNIQEFAPTGTSRLRAIRDLRAARPDLHARVITGELTPHRAMVEAGLRDHTMTVSVDDPAEVAAFVRRHFTPEQGRAIAESLLAAAASEAWERPPKKRRRRRRAARAAAS